MTPARKRAPAKQAGTTLKAAFEASLGVGGPAASSPPPAPTSGTVEATAEGTAEEAAKGAADGAVAGTALSTTARRTHPEPFVRVTLDTKSLYFSYAEIQSRMDLQRPDVLTLDYTRSMMGFLVFHPAPPRVALIGLGGGSMAKWIHRHLPATTLVAVEVNPHVIALRDEFGLPPDDARLQVVEADGANFVAQTDQRFDVLLLDAFDETGTPPALCTQRFYDDCMDTLAPGGLLVTNLHIGHPQFDVFLDRIRRSAEGRLLRMDELGGSNAVVFAGKGGQLPATHLPKRPRSIKATDWTAFNRVFSRVLYAAQVGWG